VTNSRQKQKIKSLEKKLKTALDEADYWKAANQEGYTAIETAEMAEQNMVMQCFLRSRNWRLKKNADGEYMIVDNNAIDEKSAILYE